MHWISHAPRYCLRSKRQSALRASIARRPSRLAKASPDERCSRRAHAKSRIAPAVSRQGARCLAHGANLPCTRGLLKALGTRPRGGVAAGVRVVLAAVARFFTTMHTTMLGFLASGALPVRRCELVFPRAAVRLAIQPASIVVFDPFEVHGVLTPEVRRVLPQMTTKMRRQRLRWVRTGHHPERRGCLRHTRRRAAAT